MLMSLKKSPMKRRTKTKLKLHKPMLLNKIRILKIKQNKQKLNNPRKVKLNREIHKGK